ncbi:hypothetical protein GCM10027168_53980 [Streptomyces capparidis]
MDRLGTWLGRHLWIQVVLSVLAATAIVVAISPRRSVGDVLGSVTVCSLGGVAVLLLVRRRDRRTVGGSTDTLVSLDRRLGRGEVPEDPREREAMRALVARRTHRTRHHRAALVFLFLLFGGVTALSFAAFGPREGIGFGVLSAVFLTWIAWYGARRRRGMRRVGAALGADRETRAAAPERR